MPRTPPVPVRPPTIGPGPRGPGERRDQRPPRLDELLPRLDGLPLRPLLDPTLELPRDDPDETLERVPKDVVGRAVLVGRGELVGVERRVGALVRIVGVLVMVGGALLRPVP